MDREEYVRLKQKARADYEKVLEAIEIVWSLANEGDEQPELSNVPKPEEHTPSGASDEPKTNGDERRVKSEVSSNDSAKRTKIAVLQEVRNLTIEIEGDFTQKTITQMLSERFPDARVVPSSVSGALKRLLDLKEIELVSKGGVLEPYVYRRVRPSAAQEDTTKEESAVSG